MRALFNQRRKMIVNKEVQYDVLMHVSLFVVCIFVVQIVAGYLFLNKVGDLTSLGDVTALSVKEFLSRYTILFLVYELMAVLACLLVGLVFFTRLTSRIVGPLYNMKRVLHQAAVANADSSDDMQVKLREGDYFQDLAQETNAVLKRKAK